MFTPAAPISLGTPPSPTQTNVLAILSFLSGLATWIIVPLLGALLAVVFGHLARNEISRSAGACCT